MKNLIIALRKYSSLSLSLVDKTFGTKNKLIVLSYHSISENNDFFSVTKDNFEQQLRYISKNYKPISLEDLNQFLKGNKKINTPSFILTFDDGYKDVLTIKNFLNEMGIKPILFVLSETTRINRSELGNSNDILTLAEIKVLSKSGWEIGCHSATHALLTEQDSLELNREIFQSKKRLENSLEKKVKYFAYPKGKYSDKVINQVKNSGYDLALSMDDDIISPSINPYKIPRIGINGSHSFAEFQALTSPTVIKFRKFLKSKIGGAYEKAI